MPSTSRADTHRLPREPQRITLGQSVRDDASWLLKTMLAAFVLLAVGSALIGRIYVIPSGSMEPTLHGCQGCNGDRIAVEKVSYYFADPKPGDVVVFEGEPSWNTTYELQRSHNVFIRGLQNLFAAAGLIQGDANILVKRVIATEGQTVSCQAGDPGIMVDGQARTEPYVLQPPQNPISPETGSLACGGDYFGPVTVPEDHIWVMGDNRTNSADSRAHLGDAEQGTIPVDNVRGKVRAIVMPLSRIGTVEHAHA
ncbi:S26 family signal peptidase [Corynebacterium sp. HMSC077D10]|nr:signal peptidase I [Corynebacterium phoceense]OFL78733.1 S26 family signal peptidase [Corynebacterium sp. HMSC077B05]OFN39661.1 S26 family signal peptidase [Corynebacterium sp. HMSC072G08]OFP21037.1 S26 family signal peptidase [Corynebacterium sp. HMSC065A05]OFP69444.1 S26 family signal peptidase [Corynebacterium sp. HMSC077D10]